MAAPRDSLGDEAAQIDEAAFDNAGGKRVAVGYDGRLSSPELEAQLVAEGRSGRFCHADQVSQYQGSVHGKLHAKGVQDVPGCEGCHGKHDILRVKGEKELARWMVVRALDGLRYIARASAATPDRPSRTPFTRDCNSSSPNAGRAG